MQRDCARCGGQYLSDAAGDVSCLQCGHVPGGAVYTTTPEPSAEVVVWTKPTAHKPLKSPWRHGTPVAPSRRQEYIDARRPA